MAPKETISNRSLDNFSSLEVLRARENTCGSVRASWEGQRGFEEAGKMLIIQGPSSLTDRWPVGRKFSIRQSYLGLLPCLKLRYINQRVSLAYAVPELAFASLYRFIKVSLPGCCPNDF